MLVGGVMRQGGRGHGRRQRGPRHERRVARLGASVLVAGRRRNRWRTVAMIRSAGGAAPRDRPMCATRRSKAMVAAAVGGSDCVTC